MFPPSSPPALPTCSGRNGRVDCSRVVGTELGFSERHLSPRSIPPHRSAAWAEEGHPGRRGIDTYRRPCRVSSFRDSSETHSRDLAILTLSINRIRPGLARQKGANGLLGISP